MINGAHLFYRGPVLIPDGFQLVEPEEVEISHTRTGHRFVWRTGRWLHRAACPCWKRVDKRT